MTTRHSESWFVSCAASTVIRDSEGQCSLCSNGTIQHVINKLWAIVSRQHYIDPSSDISDYRHRNATGQELL